MPFFGPLLRLTRGLYETERHEAVKKVYERMIRAAEEGAELTEGMDVAEESDAQVTLVVRIADVIGTERMATWLQEPLPAVNGQKPYTLLESEEGRKQLEAVLESAEYGVY